MRSFADADASFHLTSLPPGTITRPYETAEVNVGLGLAPSYHSRLSSPREPCTANLLKKMPALKYRANSPSGDRPPLRKTLTGERSPGRYLPDPYLGGH